MAGIPVLVQQGLNTEAIAARLGCKVGTLKVRCSQAQISLRGPKKVKTVPLVPAGQSRSGHLTLPGIVGLPCGKSRWSRICACSA